MGHTLGFPLLLEEFARRLAPLNRKQQRRNLGVRDWPKGASPVQEKYMKTKKQPTQTLPVSDAAQEHDVQQEIDRFLRALSSYPDRFAREPDLSFQQHLSSLVTATHPHNTNEARRRSE